MGNDHLDLLRRDAVSSDGAKLGHVADVYVDARTGAPKWLVVQGGVFSGGVSFVPADGAREDEGGHLVLGYTRRQVRRAPHPPADGELTTDEEATLARYYLRQGKAPAGLGAGAPPAVEEWLADPATTSEESLVRAEEELDVDTTPRAAQRARLVKRVVTEEVTFKVPLRREVLRLEYEDIDDGEADLIARTDGREPFSPVPDQEIVLYAEVVEYEKKVVPKERVRLQQDVEPREIDLRADVRKEHVDLADAPSA